MVWWHQKPDWEDSALRTMNGFVTRLTGLVLALLAAGSLAACGQAGAGDRGNVMDDAFLLSVAGQLTQEMAEFAGSGLAEAYSADAGILSRAAGVAALTGEARSAWALTLADRERLAELLGMREEDSGQDWELLKQRVHWSAVACTQINAQYGTENLAMSSILQTSRSYYVPGGAQEEVLLLLTGGGEEYASITAFYQSGEDVVSAVTCPIPAEAAAALMESAGTAGLEARELPLTS